MVSSEVERLVRAAVARVAPGVDADPALGPPKRPEWGDYATPVAMSLAKPLRRRPTEIAAEIAARLASGDGRELFAKVEVASPGYLNLTLADAFWHRRLRAVLEERERFGRSVAERRRKVLLEYVSANPTGPLHVGHARNAAVADTVANLLDASGHEVWREFYVNDVGVQMDNLGRSVWYRYRERAGRGAFPAAPPGVEALGRAPTPAEADAIERFGGLYRGDYVRDLAEAFARAVGERWLDATEDDGTVPTREAFAAARDFAYPLLLEEQRRILERYGVRFDRYFREREIHDSGLLEKGIEDLRSRGHLYERDGALWFRSTTFGDDKDRVVRKSDGSWTYFAPDLAYHREKLRRGYDLLIDAWGADHHGYIPRMRAVLAALGLDPGSFHVVLIQMVRLLKDGAEVKMSKRSGSFVTLAEIVDEVGPDAARFLMLTRSPDSPLDFDLDLAKRQSNDNPVFYVQYGHARVCSVFARASEAAPGIDPRAADLSRLVAPMERELVKTVSRFPDEVADAASRHEPHRLAAYLQELVRAFHAYYSKKDPSGAPEHRIVSEDRGLTAARLALAAGVRTVLANGLSLCGVGAPTQMPHPEERA